MVVRCDFPLTVINTSVAENHIRNRVFMLDLIRKLHGGLFNGEKFRLKSATFYTYCLCYGFTKQNPLAFA